MPARLSSPPAALYPYSTDSVHVAAYVFSVVSQRAYDSGRLAVRSLSPKVTRSGDWSFDESCSDPEGIDGGHSCLRVSIVLGRGRPDLLVFREATS